MGPTQSSVQWVPGLIPGQMGCSVYWVRDWVELDLHFVSCARQPLPFISKCAEERDSERLVSPYQTLRRLNTKDGSMITEYRYTWYVSVLVDTVCDFIRQLPTQWLTAKSSWPSTATSRVASPDQHFVVPVFSTLIEYCNSLQMHTIQSALQQRYLTDTLLTGRVLWASPGQESFFRLKLRHPVLCQWYLPFKA
jgi:hypothetical protein